MVSKIKSFFQESQQEFKRVNWPSANETMRMTASVIVMSLAVAMFLGVLDYIFTFLLGKLLL